MNRLLAKVRHIYLLQSIPTGCVACAGSLSLQVKQLGYEADHSPPSSTKVKEVELHLHSLICLHGKHRDNLTFDCDFFYYLDLHVLGLEDAEC
jgi:hypothetical protein